jgi:hypothetical protein
MASKFHRMGHLFRESASTRLVRNLQGCLRVPVIRDAVQTSGEVLASILGCWGTSGIIAPRLVLTEILKPRSFPCLVFVAAS